MTGKLVRPVGSCQHSEVEDAAAAPVEIWSSPDSTPAELGHEFLHRHREFIGGLQRLLDNLVADHLPAHRQAGLEKFLVVHTPSPTLYLRGMRVRTSRAS